MVSGFLRSTFWAFMVTLNSVCAVILIFWLTTFEWNMDSLRTVHQTTRSAAHKIGLNVLKLNEQIQHPGAKIIATDPDIVFFHDPKSGNIYASVRKQKVQ